LLWLTIAVLQGVRRPGAALLGGMLGALTARVLQTGFWGLVPGITDPTIPGILFGFSCIALANQPDGALHSISLQNYQRRQRRRAKKAAAVAAPAAVPVAARRTVDVVASTSERPLPVSDSVPAVALPSMNGGAPALQISGLVTGYVDAEVLHGMDLVVPRGSIVALLGPNGTGKSTLCAAIAGTLPVWRGSISIEGRDATREPAHRRADAGLRVVPESRGIFPALSVEDNLEVSLPSRSQRDAAYDRFPLLAARRRLPAGSLSGGEQQMLSLAPILVAPPRVLVADEVTLGLAPTVVARILTYIQELRREGVSILMVEEKARNVLDVADYCAFLTGGRLAAWGPTGEFTHELAAERYMGVTSSVSESAE
jgi:ABC-type branched-subunit amino acid transport system ATPase component